jgi:hypothetical protein
MATVSIASMISVPEMGVDDDSPKIILLFCCIGLIVSLCLMTLGIDLSADWV